MQLRAQRFSAKSQIPRRTARVAFSPASALSPSSNGASTVEKAGERLVARARAPGRAHWACAQQALTRHLWLPHLTLVQQPHAQLGTIGDWFWIPGIPCIGHVHRAPTRADLDGVIGDVRPRSGPLRRSACHRARAPTLRSHAAERGVCCGGGRALEQDGWVQGGSGCAGRPQRNPV